MAAALTLEEKKERALAKRAENTTTRTGRRNAFNGTEGKLRVDGTIDGYHMYIFNDVAGRIDNALQSGWEFVSPNEIAGVGTNVVSRNTDIGDKVRFLVGRAEDGGPLYAYLMKIKQDWSEEDQAALQQKTNNVDAAIRRGEAPGVNTEGFYVPKEGIKMK